MPSFRVCSIALLSTAFASNITLFPDGAPDEVAGWPGPEVTLAGDDGIVRVYNVSAPTLEPFPLEGVAAAGGPATHTDLSSSRLTSRSAIARARFGTPTVCAQPSSRR